MMFYRSTEATAAGQLTGWDGYGFAGHMFGANNPMMSFMDPVFGIFWLTTWALIVVALIALIRWLWKKGN